MKENILIALAVLLLASMWIQFSAQSNNNRYDVVSSNNMLTVLIDKKTGQTWRNCVCSEKSPIPGCWEKMHIINPQPYMQPVGEAKLSKKLMKEAAKMKKLQEKEQQSSNTTVIGGSQPQQEQK